MRSAGRDITRELTRRATARQPSTLERYASNLGLLLDRHATTAALRAAKAEADMRAVDAHQAMVEARSLNQALREEIDQRMKTQSRLAYLASHDPLTGLPNRTLLHDRLGREMDVARSRNYMLALHYLDLDHFKNVNDTLGHAVGDSLLREVATRLLGCVRQGDTVARMGGDEFAVLQGGLTDVDDAKALAERVIAALSVPIEIAGRRLFVGSSVGITVFPGDAEGADMLLRNADLAMYCAKKDGGNLFHFFDTVLNEEAHRRATLEHSLREAIALNQISVVYQEQVSVATGRITGVEALLRWQHPEHGTVTPDEFIPVAERCGLINQLGTWVLREACRQAVRWDQAGMPPVTMAVNVATAQFRGGDVPRLVAEVLAETGLPANRLELEITETGVMQDMRDTADMLGALHNLGVGLAIDDFGTGYSSLSYLRRLPVDRIKIDRSFVADVTHSEDAAVIARTIVTLAHNLRLEVVAEGVETEGHANFIRETGCNYAQGFYYGCPAEAHSILARYALQAAAAE
jgi:diguanylate cyclase (GGDEF)-like protein